MVLACSKGSFCSKHGSPSLRNGGLKKKIGTRKYQSNLPSIPSSCIPAFPCRSSKRELKHTSLLRQTEESCIHGSDISNEICSCCWRIHSFVVTLAETHIINSSFTAFASSQTFTLNWRIRMRKIPNGAIAMCACVCGKHSHLWQYQNPTTPRQKTAIIK